MLRRTANCTEYHRFMDLFRGKGPWTRDSGSFPLAYGHVMHHQARLDLIFGLIQVKLVYWLNLSHQNLCFKPYVRITSFPRTAWHSRDVPGSQLPAERFPLCSHRRWGLREDPCRDGGGLKVLRGEIPREQHIFHQVPTESVLGPPNRARGKWELIGFPNYTQ